MLNGGSNMTGAGGASLRLLSFGARPASAATPPALPSAGTPSAIPTAPAAPVPAPIAANAAAPRLLGYQSSTNIEQALEAVRQDATSFMSSALAALTTATAQLLPALSALRERLAALTSGAPAKAPAPKPKPAGKPKADKPKPKPAPAPAKPKAPKKPTSAANFKDMLGISNGRLAKVLAIPADSARKNLPVIAQAIKEAGIKNKNAIIGLLATIKTEVGNFQPIHEYGGPSYWARYNGRSDLGNRPGTNDGVTYHGRGYIQLTGRANYTTYGKQIGVNLVKTPDKALDPKVAAKVLVQYFENRGLVKEASEGDWMAVRKGVNGGTNGWDRFIASVGQLKKAVYK